MNPPPPVFRDQRKIDDEHLKLLSLFHFIGAGLAVLGLLFLMVHFAVFHFVFQNPQMWEHSKQGPPPQFFFSILKFFYLLFGIWFATSGVLNLMSGLFLRARKHRTFSMVVAIINCLHMPMGTVLGVFTMIVLMRDSVRDLYQNQPVTI